MGELWAWIDQDLCTAAPDHPSFTPEDESPADDGRGQEPADAPHALAAQDGRWGWPPAFTVRWHHRGRSTN